MSKFSDQLNELAEDLAGKAIAWHDAGTQEWEADLADQLHGAAELLEAAAEIHKLHSSESESEDDR